jgi:hypothetical protein
MQPEDDQRTARALAWVTTLRRELDREHVLPSCLVRLLSEGLSVVESFLAPQTPAVEREPEELFLEAERILASIGGPLGSRSDVERALRLLTTAIDRAKAAGKPVSASYQLRSHVYEMLAKIDRNISIIQSGLEMTSSRPPLASKDQISLFK